MRHKAAPRLPRRTHLGLPNDEDPRLAASNDNDKTQQMPRTFPQFHSNEDDTGAPHAVATSTLLHHPLRSRIRFFFCSCIATVVRNFANFCRVPIINRAPCKASILSQALGRVLVLRQGLIRSVLSTGYVSVHQ